MEESNVNNLNGVPNFGHGLPDDGVVIAGESDVSDELSVSEISHEEEQEDVPAVESKEEEVNG